VFEGLLLALFVVELLLDLTSQSALFICIGAWDAVVTLPSVAVYITALVYFGKVSERRGAG